MATIRSDGRCVACGSRLRLLHVAYGYLDGATPYYAAQETFAHLAVPRERLDDIEHRYYEAGHMMYVHEPTRRRQSADLAHFVVRSSAGRT